MSFRVRLVLAFALIATLPLLGLAWGLERAVDRRMTSQYRSRVDALAAVTRGALSRESGAIADRLASLRGAIADDDRLRVAIARPGDEQSYLLDYGGRAMRLTGLAALQLQDSAGRILSSGHFRNEYDRLEPDLPRLLAAAPGGAALVAMRTPEGPLMVIARTDSLRLGGRRLSLVGGVAVDERFLSALAADSVMTVSLRTPDADSATAAPSGSPDATIVTRFAFPFVDRSALRSAQFVVAHTTDDLDAIRASVGRVVVTALVTTALVAVLAAIWLAAYIGRPLAALADATARVDLDRLDVQFATTRTDEIGVLARLLGAMTRRLRTSAMQQREAERRATIGDLARQVTHDVKNGLAPLRHVHRHLDQVAREDPARLAAVFVERRPTLDASVEYLDALARNYARLTPRLDVRPVDVNALIRAIAGGAVAPVQVDLDARLAPLAVDPLVLRRILDNLVANGVEALADRDGTVTIASAAVEGGGARITVADTGPGMTEAQLARAFNDFYTTKPTGTGLGLSIVRRLAADLGANLAIDTTPGAGTRVAITFPGAP